MSSTKHSPPARFDDIPGSLPNTSVPNGVDNTAVAHTVLGLLNNLQKDKLASNVIWRDFLAFTDTYRTFYSPDVVFDTLQDLGSNKQRSAFSLAESEPKLVVCGDSSWLDIDVTFSVRDSNLVGQSAGVVSVTPDPKDNQWKIWMLRTWLEHYEGHGNPDRLEPNPNRQHADGATNGADQHIYDVIIVGGGQAGLGTAGRCQALGLDYVVFDERPSIGESWSTRYDSLRWHTIREYGNLPFGRTFRSDDENFLTKDRIGEGYREWAEKFGLNTRCSTHVDHADWDEASQLWTVYTGAHGQEKWKSRDLVLCMGPGHQNPVYPDWALEHRVQSSGYKGTLIHAAHWRNAQPWAGKRGIVVGTANSGHDVAEDMANAGMETTMLQRNATFIFPGDWLAAIQTKDYNQDKPTEVADREALTQPLKIAREIVKHGVWTGIRNNPKLFDDLEKAGFKVHRYGDLFDHIYNRFGGHYVDVGNCARIIKGEVKVVGTPVKGLTETGVEFEDGSRLDADLIVYATGYDHDFRKDATQIVGADIAEQMDDFLGLDKEGEPRGWARLAGHPHLFYYGGEVRTARFFSRFIALQIQKGKLGGTLRPYLKGKL